MPDHTRWMFHSLLHSNRLTGSDTLENHKIWCNFHTTQMFSLFCQIFSSCPLWKYCNIWLPVVVVGASVVVVVVVGRTVVPSMKNRGKLKFEIKYIHCNVTYEISLRLAVLQTINATYFRMERMSRSILLLVKLDHTWKGCSQ